MSADKVKTKCAKCNTVKPLVPHRTICRDCNLARKREIAARKQSTPEGKEANRAKAAAFRATEEGKNYQRAYEQKPEVRERRNAATREWGNSPEGRACRERYASRPEVQARRRENEQRRMADPERRAQRVASVKAWLSTPAGRAGRILAQARKRAPVTVPQDRVEAAIERGFCEVTGIPFDLTGAPNGFRTHPWAPSIDRIDSSGVYTPENVQIVCWAYNCAKNEFGSDVLLRLAHAIVDNPPQ